MGDRAKRIRGQELDGASPEGAVIRVDFFERHAHLGQYWGGWPKDQTDTPHFRRLFGSSEFTVVQEYYDLDGKLDPDNVSLFKKSS